MKPFRIDIPPHVADVLRSLHPDLKRSLKAALRTLALDPHYGEPLLRELSGLNKYRVRRFRIVYRINQTSKAIQVMAVGPRRHIYEELAERLHRHREK